MARYRLHSRKIAKKILLPEYFTYSGHPTQLVIGPMKCILHTASRYIANMEYLKVLNSALKVFGDETGVRWAAGFRDVKIKDNLLGTDLIPALLEKSAGKAYRYFLLGGDMDTIERAACAKTGGCPMSYVGS